MMLKRHKVFLYTYIIVVIIRVGLIFPTRQSANEMIGIAEKFENVKNEVDKFKSFDDSLAGNEGFSRRLLDTFPTAAELRQGRANQKDELTKKIEELRTLYPDRDKVILKYKILRGLSHLMSILFVCMAIPLLIYVFKGR